MDDNAIEVRNDTLRLRRSAIAAVCFVGLIWIIWLTDLVLNLGLRQFGVYPREPDGLIGILTAPLIHGSFKHVFSNTLPAFILGTAFLYGPASEKKPAFGSFAVAKSDNEFRRTINSVLDAYIGSPSHRTMMASFGFTDAEIDLLIDQG